MIDFVQIQNFFIVLMAILGFIAVLGGIVNMLIKWNKESRSKKNEERLDNVEKRVEKLESKTNEQESFIQVLCSSLLAMISHEINGNSKDKLEKAKAELEKFLISK